MKLIHNDGETALFKTNDHWSIFIGKVDLLATAKHINTYNDGRHVWQALTPLHDGWMRIRVMARDGSSVVRFWAWWVPGDTSKEAPRIAQPELRIISTPSLPPQVDFTICDASPLEKDPENDGYTIGGRLHGQGIPMRRFYVDFGTQTWGGRHVEAPNDYMPRDPNQTGGTWPYMGLTFPTAVIDLEEVYSIGAYGGFFQDDDGELVSEQDYPDLQADSHIHEHSKDEGWIKYTDPSNTWRDKLSVMRTNPDGQHLCQPSVLGQMLEEYPEDEGLKMLGEAWSHVYTRQFPKVNRGTTHASPGQERSQGRVLKSGVDCFAGLHAVGDNESALRFGRRAIERWENDKKQFLANLAEHGVGFARFGRSGAYPTGEIGIHYWGMWRLHQLIDELLAPHMEGVHFWMREASRWCFESYRFYDIQGHRHWSYPYFEDKDHNDLSGPVSKAHFGWLAASHFKPRNPTEIEKHKAIMALGDGMEARFKG